jgi:phosphatidylethanolamine/phosphatidyl-N-methylethanolamine N-methyltransferase
MRAEIDKVGIKKAYARWAPVYDLVFGGALFDRGRRAAIEAADGVGGTILEVGVGTGISLRDYSATTASSASIFRSRCCGKRELGFRSLRSLMSSGSR